MWLPFIPTPGTLPAGTLEREWEREGFCVCQRQRPRKIFKLLSNFLHHPYVRLLPSFLHLRDSDSDLLLRHLIQIITTLSLLFHPRPTERKLPLSPITFLISRVLSIIVECLNVHNLHHIKSHPVREKPFGSKNTMCCSTSLFYIISYIGCYGSGHTDTMALIITYCNKTTGVQEFYAELVAIERHSMVQLYERKENHSVEEGVFRSADHRPHIHEWSM